MAYPPPYFRHANFARDEQLGERSPRPAALDAELNAIQTTLDGVLGIIRKITSPTHRLTIGVGDKTALSLIGQWTGAPVAPNAIETTIPFAPVAPAQVLIVSNGKTLAPSDVVSILSSSGNIKIVTGVAVEAPVSVWVFAPQQGLENRLLSDAEGDGASRVAIHDEHGLFASVNVEDALTELALALQSFVTAVGDLSRYFFRDGSRTAQGHFDLNGHRIRNLASGVDPDDAVNLQQVQAMINVGMLDTSSFLLLDGSRPMIGALQMGNNRITGVQDPNGPTDAVNYQTLTSYVGTTISAVVGDVPVGTIVPVAGILTNPRWLLCDGSEHNALTYPDLYAILPASMKTAHTFRVPDLRGRTTLGAGRLAKSVGGTDYFDTANGDEYTSRVHHLGGYVGKEYHRLTIAEMPSHNHPPPHPYTHFRVYQTGSGPGDSTFEQSDRVGHTGYAGGDAPHENLPPAFIVNYYIKAKEFGSP